MARKLSLFEKHTRTRKQKIDYLFEKFIFEIEEEIAYAKKCSGKRPAANLDRLRQSQSLRTAIATLFDLGVELVVKARPSQSFIIQQERSP